MRYQIRAELPDNHYEDFEIVGPGPTDERGLDKARKRAEAELIKRYPKIESPAFDWRGQVVFMTPRPEAQISLDPRVVWR